jgi:uncharacterized protein DUF4406
VLKIYVAGPLSTGTYNDVVRNVRNAIDHADSIMLLGAAPYLPHLTHFWNLFHPHQWQEWMNLDREYLLKCDAILRLPGESKGADQEVTWAKAAGLPVYYTMVEVEHAVRQAVRSPGLL